MFFRKKKDEDKLRALGTLLAILSEVGLNINIPEVNKYREKVIKKYGNAVILGLVEDGELTLDGGGYLKIGKYRIEELAEDYEELKNNLPYVRDIILRKFVIALMKKHITLERGLRRIGALTPAAVKRLIDARIPLTTSVVMAKITGTPLWRELDEEYRARFLDLIAENSILMDHRFLELLSKSETDREIVKKYVKEAFRKGKIFVATALARAVVPKLVAEDATKYPLYRAMNHFCIGCGEWCIALLEYPVSEERKFVVFPRNGGYGVVYVGKSIREVCERASKTYDRVRVKFEELKKFRLITPTKKSVGPFTLVTVSIGGRRMPLSEKLLQIRVAQQDSA